MNKYVARPLNTSDIDVDKSLADLLEKLSHNTHDVWAQGRMQDGWVYGEKRNDDNKQHPCLVPYEELPESEKEYDRNTVLETVKLVLKLGYSIVPV